MIGRKKERTNKIFTRKKKKKKETGTNALKDRIRQDEGSRIWPYEKGEESN